MDAIGSRVLELAGAVREARLGDLDWLPLEGDPAEARQALQLAAEDVVRAESAAELLQLVIDEWREEREVWLGVAE